MAKPWPKTATLVVVAGSVALLVLFAQAQRPAPHCPPGLVAMGPRCCGATQHIENGACAGEPASCGPLEKQGQACVMPNRRIAIPAGTSSWKSPDTTVVATSEPTISNDFWLDRTEVTWKRYRQCEAKKVCVTLATSWGGDDGQAVSGLTQDEARAFCRFEGGRLPTDAEWLRAGLGDVETRYPWGDPDALCLRATFALRAGRCGFGAKGPDTAGARPWGATPLGLLDMAGNVAEWIDDRAPMGQAVVRGGSWQDEDATLLRARSRRLVVATSRFDWVGVRCAYDQASR